MEKIKRKKGRRYADRKGRVRRQNLKERANWHHRKDGNSVKDFEDGLIRLTVC